ncbi:MAG: TRAP transporter substrate-binding protein [Haliangiales bacterium]
MTTSSDDHSASAGAPTKPGMSLPAALVAIGVAFAVGLAASLAVRPPSTEVAAGGTSGDGTTKPTEDSAARPAAVDDLSWRIPIAFGTNLPALGDNILYVQEHLERSSAGAIAWKIFEPGKIVPPLGITESVKDKKVPAGYTWLGYDQGKLPSSALFAAVPFGMEPWEYMAWWYEGGGHELAEEVYGTLGVRPILCGLIGPETAGWFRNEINTLDDLNGLKIRFAGLGGKVLQELGASVTVLPGGEIFQALEKGAIDASEFSMPSIDQRLGFDRVVKINYFPGWHQTYTAFHLVVNEELWSELQPSTQDLIQTTCTAGVTRNLAFGESLQGDIISGFPDKGVSAKSLPLDLLRELQQVTTRVMDAEAAKDPFFAKVYESQKQFSANYQHWKRLAYLPRDF